MLPIRIELRNFLAYRSPTPVSFEGIHLACLSGPNGAGKSSLLDAMTWALWGHARGRGDDDLIHLGQEEMSVVLDFEQDTIRYRVQRERNRNGRGTLYLSRWDAEACKFTDTIGGANNRTQTQEQIVRLLRLDYETFIQSAFMQQGKADAFTTARPGQRKETLGKILRLAEWEDRESRVKARLTEITNRISAIDLKIQDDEREEAEFPRLTEDLQRAQHDLEQAVEIRDEAEKRFDEVAGTEAALTGARSTRDTLLRRIHTIRDEIARLTTQKGSYLKRRADYQTVLAQHEAIEAAYAQLLFARDTIDTQGEKLRRVREAEKHLNTLKNQLNNARSTLHHELQASADRIARVTADWEHGSKAAAEYAQIEADLEALNERAAEADRLREAIDGLSHASTDLHAKNEALKNERDRLRNHLRLLKGAEAECPVCHQPLNSDHRDALEAEYTQAGLACKREFDTNAAQIAAHEAQGQTYQGQIDRIKIEIRRRDSLNKQAGGLRQQIERASHAEAEIAAEQEHQVEIQVRLDTEDFAPELREEIDIVAAEIAALGYDDTIYQEAVEQQKLLKDYEPRKRDLDIAQSALPVLDAQIEALEQELFTKTADLDRESDDKARLDAEIAGLEAGFKEYEQRRDQRTKARKDEQEAMRRLHTIEQKLHAIERMREKKRKNREEQEALKEQQLLFEELRKAFSKNGVPAMIIEAAIPELENTTNRLLTRMTDGRMHVRFDTQRENKSGSVSETFDIRIADELGERDYETFSGGEGFRINFALRVALSQFLAHRAGARLQTLVIDEGFGSQDSAGRDRLVEAINAISNDFDLILIVTHIDELRDQFPVLIEISKTDKGSIITVR
jgi:exonuclease SbcC